jgi:hypothetical protein
MILNYLLKKLLQVFYRGQQLLPYALILLFLFFLSLLRFLGQGIAIYSEVGLIGANHHCGATIHLRKFLIVIH